MIPKYVSPGLGTFPAVCDFSTGLSPLSPPQSLGAAGLYLPSCLPFSVDGSHLGLVLDSALPCLPHLIHHLRLSALLASVSEITNSLYASYPGPSPCPPPTCHLHVSVTSVLVSLVPPHPCRVRRTFININQIMSLYSLSLSKTIPW